MPCLLNSKENPSFRRGKSKDTCALSRILPCQTRRRTSTRKREVNHVVRSLPLHRTRRNARPPGRNHRPAGPPEAPAGFCRSLGGPGRPAERRGSGLGRRVDLRHHRQGAISGAGRFRRHRGQPVRAGCSHPVEHRHVRLGTETAAVLRRAGGDARPRCAHRHRGPTTPLGARRRLRRLRNDRRHRVVRQRHRHNRHEGADGSAGGGRGRRITVGHASADLPGPRRGHGRPYRTQTPPATPLPERDRTALVPDGGRHDRCRCPRGQRSGALPPGPSRGRGG